MESIHLFYRATGCLVRCLIKTKLSANSKSSSLNLGSVSVYLAMLRMSNGVSDAFALCPMRNIFTGFDVAFLIMALVDFRKLAKDSKHSGRETVCKAKPFLWSTRSLPNDAMRNLLILLTYILKVVFKTRVKCLVSSSFPKAKLGYLLFKLIDFSFLNASSIYYFRIQG